MGIDDAASKESQLEKRVAVIRAVHNHGAQRCVL